MTTIQIHDVMRCVSVVSFPKFIVTRLQPQLSELICELQPGPFKVTGLIFGGVAVLSGSWLDIRWETPNQTTTIQYSSFIHPVQGTDNYTKQYVQ